jgi:hypothetical protein
MQEGTIAVEIFSNLLARRECASRYSFEVSAWKRKLDGVVRKVREVFEEEYGSVGLGSRSEVSAVC